MKHLTNSFFFSKIYRIIDESQLTKYVHKIKSEKKREGMVLILTGFRQNKNKKSF